MQGEQNSGCERHSANGCSNEGLELEAPRSFTVGKSKCKTLFPVQPYETNRLAGTTGLSLRL